MLRERLMTRENNNDFFTALKVDYCATSVNFLTN